MAKLHQRAAGTENHQGFLHRFCQNNGFPAHLRSGFYPVYRPVGQSVVRHMMVNVSAARRESRSRKGIRDIHHHKLEA